MLKTGYSVKMASEWRFLYFLSFRCSFLSFFVNYRDLTLLAIIEDRRHKVYIVRIIRRTTRDKMLTANSIRWLCFPTFSRYCVYPLLPLFFFGRNTNESYPWSCYMTCCTVYSATAGRHLQNKTNSNVPYIMLIPTLFVYRGNLTKRWRHYWNGLYRIQGYDCAIWWCRVILSIA